MHGLHEWARFEQQTATKAYRADDWPIEAFESPDPEPLAVQWIDLQAELEQLHSGGSNVRG